MRLEEEGWRRYELRVYIDTNVFIYTIFAHPLFGKECKGVIDDVEEGKIEAIVSTLVPIEVMSVIADMEPSKSRTALESIYSLPLRIVDASSEILLLAAELAEKHRVGGYDAVHIATSITERADCIITNDRQFRRVKEVKITSPSQYATFRK